MTRVVESIAFDEALLAEVSRLLPEADVVHDVRRPAPVGDVPVSTARRSVEIAARRAVAHTVNAWSAVYPGVAPPGHLAVDLGTVDDERVRVIATVQRDAGGPTVSREAGAVADALAGLDWDVQRRDAGHGFVNLLALRPGWRLDAVARPPSLFALRVTDGPIEVGAVAGSLAQQPRRLVPWPRSR
jgi:hypothetical protein